MRTHPLFSDRIEAARHHLAKSPYSGTPDKPAYREAHARMRAKLIGFLNPPEQTLREYPTSDIRIPATYARAVAYHKAHRPEKSLAEMASLLNRRPDDPYFHELRGQILLESGRIDEAIPSYRAALRVLRDEPQILVGLGQALVAQEKPEDLEEAVEVLRRATQFDPGLTSAWRWLAVRLWAFGQYRHGLPGDGGALYADRPAQGRGRPGAACRAPSGGRLTGPSACPGHYFNGPATAEIAAVGATKKQVNVMVEILMFKRR